MKFRVLQRILVFLSVSTFLSSLTSVVLANASLPSDQYSQSIQQGAVATVHPLATQAAINTLQNGGNAIDAAVTAAFTLGVVDSHNSGIGGGSFVLVRWANGTVEAIDGREMAPAKSHRDMYLVNGKASSNLSRTGALAIGIPGSLAAYDYLLSKGGKYSLAQAIKPAADIAETGFPIDNIYAKRLKAKQEDIKKFPASAKVLLSPKQVPWPPEHKLIQTDLAKTYQAIAKQGIKHFYQGEFAKRTEQWMKANDGIITAQDFANYELKIREPIKTQYRDYELYGFPPPSSGGTHVAQILNILESYPLAKLNDIDRLHVTAEAMKLAFADRAHWLGDADFTPVPKGLTDKSYAKALSQQIDLNKAGTVHGHSTPPQPETDLFGKHTTHLTAADKWGNWVAITTTLNTSFGSKVIIPGTGVLMNNQMDDFSAQPGVPNAYGLVGNEANSIQPGKRPLSSMSPTLVTHKRQPILTLGAAGGPTIITQVVQGLINYLDLNMPLEQAIAAPRIHHQWKPDQLRVEKTLPAEIQQQLEKKGHKLKPFFGYGSTQAIAISSTPPRDPASKSNNSPWQAVSEPRLKQRNQ